MRTIQPPRYALFHVHRQSGETVRFPPASFPSMQKEEAEQRALDIRIGAARGSYRLGLWETRALPEEDEKA